MQGNSVPAAVKRAPLDAYKSGTRNFGDIAWAVKNATDQAVRFPAIGEALRAVRKPKPWRRSEAKARGKRASPPKAGKRGPGRPRKARRRGLRRPKAPRRVPAFLVAIPKGQSWSYRPAATPADVKNRVGAYVAKNGDADGLLVYAGRKVKVESRVVVSV